MLGNINAFVILLVSVTTVHSLHLPSYFTACKKSDPNLNKCALESSKAGQPTFVNGDPKYKVINLNPVFIQSVDVNPGPNLNLTFSNLVCSGIKDAIQQEVKFNLEKNEFYFKAIVPNFNFKGKYEGNGKILVLPVQGKGDSNITFVDGEYVYTTGWKLVQKGGKEYAKLEHPNLALKVKRAYFQFDNLFNGDKLLGEQVNKFLNDNWSDVMEDVGKGLGKTFEAVFTSVLQSYFDAIPFDEIFID